MQTKNYLPAFFITAIFVVVISLSFSPPNRNRTENCMMAVTYSEMAMGQFKKAYKASEMDKVKAALKKGMAQIKQASAYAAQCQCSPAETYALTSYTIAKKIYEEGINITTMKPDIKKALDISVDAFGAAQQCNK